MDHDVQPAVAVHVRQHEVPLVGRHGQRDRERVRILGIDTPEVAHHSMGWYDDQPYGRQATAFAEGVFVTYSWPAMNRSDHR